MKNRDRSEVRRWLMLATFVSATACAASKGESQLGYLQSGLESEFPDHGVSSTLDLSGKTEPPVHGPSTVAPAPPPRDPAPQGPQPEPMVTADDTTARPVIKVVGNGKVHPAGRGANDHIELIVPDEHAVASPATASAPLTPALLGMKSAADPTAKQEYDRGLALLNARDYDHALEALQAFLMRFPEDANAEAALYWTGECYLAKGELLDATAQFEAALTRFPQGGKVPDDLLKLGITTQRLGNKEGAKAYFERLAREYPKSDAVRRVPHDML